jgi:S1-C subfamily serine protease
LQDGDVVIKMGDLEVLDMMSYMKALGAFNKGETVDVEVMRNGKSITTAITF